MILPLNIPKSKSCIRPLTRIFSETNKQIFVDKLSNTDWSSITHNSSNINTVYDNFATHLSRLYEISFPLVKVSRKRFKDKKWITPAIIKSSIRKVNYTKFGWHLKTLLKTLL